MKLTKQNLYNLIKEEYEKSERNSLMEAASLDEVIGLFASPDLGEVEHAAEFMFSLMVADEEEPLYGGKYGEITLSFEDGELYNKIRDAVEQRIKDYFNSKYPEREGIAYAEISRRLRGGDVGGYIVGDNPGVATNFLFHDGNKITVTDYSTS